MSEFVYTEGVAFRPKNPALFGVCMLKRGEEIIRCRDCKGSEDGPWHKCETFVAHGEDANGFCAWAERRES